MPKNLIFLSSSSSYDSILTETGAEIAFAGRSNSGKSSIINTLAGRRSPARTSSVPGKTRHINFFAVNGQSEQRLTDLPGYGYARVSGKEMEWWKRELTRYITERKSLVGVIITIDIRRFLTELDLQMLQLCQIAGRPVHALLNKLDKLKNSQKTAVRNSIARELKLLYPEASMGTFSALKREGVEELWRVIHNWFNKGCPLER